MKKVALVFVLAVFVPSLVLAWLAVRSLRDQQFLLERQQSLLYQGVADALANSVQDALAEQQRTFTLKVAALLRDHTPQQAAQSFDELLRQDWPLAQVGFVVTLAGQILSPVAPAQVESRAFLAANGRFLANRESAEIYLNAGNQLGQVFNTKAVQRAVAPQKKGAQEALPLNQAQQLQSVDFQNPSKLTPLETEFRQLIGEADEGTLARFVDNKLNLLVWRRSPQDPNLVFGAQLALPRLIENLRPLVNRVEPALRSEVCVALLDDNAKPIALSQPGFRANWKRPFVATEIGDALPHWEVAVYLLDPAKLSQSARTLKLTLGLLITVLVLAIAVGSWLIVTDLNRQLTLARQKTDFVSNVSHELKTPLTSIRMFSELLAEGRVADAAKQRSYLEIITAETARLTRLINNVLDFARIERGEKKYNLQRCDLAGVIREIAGTYRPHLEAEGFRFECDLPPTPVFINGDRDALAQVIVNLLSNAEKYSDHGKEVSLRLCQETAPLPHVEVKVLDRGLGVPRGCEEKIFEQFYRAHDALSSGIQGSGLGLTLARQIARVHGGDVAYEPREGGGSCFSLRLPVWPGA